ncbi:MAG: 16S rRNA (cytidine(1402)-2'-O)-methyltransferase [Deltaproteobacteria bacterium]|nr:16S rRNA (cytidine(1402)-2'-O)-methyltransferase [Deltaproteobacteria bacterium]HCH63910.1 16S rRNA (cytidine(1402)-2'-O)-methyltransferase [Deltaproteobacteria bacterium]
MPTSKSVATVGEEPEVGVLYIVPTPLGHRGDLSPRAIHLLSNVDVLLCEDTRVTRKLLADLSARPELHSCHDHNEQRRVEQVLRWLAAERRVALVSDAGTPLVSDPGFVLARAVLDAGFRLIALPGPVAAVTALAASGLPPDRFTFAGFVPRKPKDRRAWLSGLAERSDTLVMYCSCHRLLADLAAIEGELGDRRAVASRDLTKRGELHLRGPLSALQAKLGAMDRITGEWTVCVAGADAPVDDAGLAETVVDLVHAMVDAGMSPRAVRDLVCAVSEASKKQVYAAALTRRETTGLAPR